MAKVIKYTFLSCEINRGTKAKPDVEQVFLNKEIYCKTEAIYQANLPVAQREAWNGVYTVVEDDGKENSEPTAFDVLEAQVVYTAMMTDTLLEG